MYRLVFEERAGGRAPFVSNRATVAIGRDAGCELRLVDSGIHDRHATLERRADGYYIRDLTRAHGVRLNGQVTTEQRLATGDELELGAVRLRFEIVHEPPPGRRAFDPWQGLAVIVIVALVGAQLALFGWIFTTPHPRDARTDAGRTASAKQSPTEAAPAIPSLLPLETSRTAAAPTATPDVLNRMIKIVRVDRLDAKDSVTLRISVKAQVGDRQLDATAVAIGVQFFGPPGAANEPAWLKIPRGWSNFSSQQVQARFNSPPAQCAGYVVRTYYRKQLQDVAAVPALEPGTAAPSAP
jgi:predicted component of type VI protein secretion system